MACILPVILVVVACVILTLSGIPRKLREMKKYEFDNTSSGGVVQFPTFEAAEAHRVRKARLKIAQMFVFLATLIGGAVLCFVAYALMGGLR